MLIAVFDIGGGHVSYGYFDALLSRVIDDGANPVQSIPIDETNSLTVLLELVTNAKRFHGSSLCGLSVAVPGPFNYSSGISQMQHKLVPLYGLNLKRMISKISQLSEVDIMFFNDADAFLLGALFALNASTGRSVGITLGTGVGSAFALGTGIIHDGYGVPEYGEIWNLPYKQGYVEDFISTRKLELDYLSRTGIRRSVKSIAQAAYDGEIAGLEVFESFGIELAGVLQQICYQFDPERILIGGGITGAAKLFFPALQTSRWCSDRVSVVPRNELTPLLGCGVGWIRAASDRVGCQPSLPCKRGNEV